jgi:poly [ADP-ribose] polymerase 2/3/4
MDNRRRLDPPGTINPIILFQRDLVPTDTALEAFDTTCPPPHPSEKQVGHQRVISATSIPKRSGPNIPPLPRISSDWDSELDIVLRGNSKHQDIRKEFEDSHVAKLRRSTTRARYTSHHGYFRSQTGDGARLFIPVDELVGPNATVVVDRASSSIYDAYLLRVDITNNTNRFRRHQVG